MKDAHGVTFTYRASSKSGPPTIDVNGISGLEKSSSWRNDIKKINDSKNFKILKDNFLKIFKDKDPFVDAFSDNIQAKTLFFRLMDII